MNMMICGSSRIIQSSSVPKRLTLAQNLPSPSSQLSRRLFEHPAQNKSLLSAGPTDRQHLLLPTRGLPSSLRDRKHLIPQAGRIEIVLRSLVGGRVVDCWCPSVVRGSRRTPGNRTPTSIGRFRTPALSLWHVPTLT